MKVMLNKTGEDDLADLDPTVQEAARAEAKGLRKWPEVSGVKKLTGAWAGLSRVKVKGDWRLIFRVLEDKKLIVIVRIRHRSVAYKP